MGQRLRCPITSSSWFASHSERSLDIPRPDNQAGTARNNEMQHLQTVRAFRWFIKHNFWANTLLSFPRTIVQLKIWTCFSWESRFSSTLQRLKRVLFCLLTALASIKNIDDRRFKRSIYRTVRVLFQQWSCVRALADCVGLNSSWKFFMNTYIT
jgi:hypothetical protein